MLTGIKGLALIKTFESCSLTAYPDPASDLGKATAQLDLAMPEYRGVKDWQDLDPGPVTIGWGHTGKAVDLGDEISQETADALLSTDVHYAEYLLHGLDLNQNQFDALVSLAYNCPSALRGTTLRHLLEARDYEVAADQILLWHYANHKPLAGLMTRRAAERELFLTPVVSA